MTLYLIRIFAESSAHVKTQKHKKIVGGVFFIGGVILALQRCPPLERALSEVRRALLRMNAKKKRLGFTCKLVASPI